MERKCNNCNYKPCTRQECGEEGTCQYQKFPHETVMEEVIKEYYKKNPDWEGLR